MLHNVEDMRRRSNEPFYNQPWELDLDACLVVHQSPVISLESHVEFYENLGINCKLKKKSNAMHPLVSNKVCPYIPPFIQGEL